MARSERLWHNRQDRKGLLVHLSRRLLVSLVAVLALTATGLTAAAYAVRHSGAGAGRPVANPSATRTVPPPTAPSTDHQGHHKQRSDNGRHLGWRIAPGHQDRHSAGRDGDRHDTGRHLGWRKHSERDAHDRGRPVGKHDTSHRRGAPDRRDDVRDCDEPG